MERGRRLNKKRVGATIAVFILVVIVLGGSALLTKDSKKKGKNLEIKEPKLANSNIKEEAQENLPEENSSDVTVAQETTEEPVENVPELVKQEPVKQETVEKPVETPKQETVVTETKKEKPVQQTTTKVATGRLPVANENSIALCKQAQTSSEKNIYLTFDDGPSPNITPQVLEVLEEYNVPATFFVLGSRVELYPDLVRQEYNAGHYIANHGYSHTYSSIYSSVQSVIDEYNAAEKAVQDALGIPEYHTLLFRFPGGSSGGPYNDLKQQAKSTLENMGIASTNWNCLNGDAEGGSRTKEQLINRLYETAEGWDSLVVLMHDANDKQTTVDALPEIIEHYLAEGYTFKNYYDIFQ